MAVTVSPLRIGSHGEAVRDVQRRLAVAALPLEPDGDYGVETERAVRTFQQRRGLRVDGICGPETWAALIESGFSLGDRLLYLCQPMQRGDDVAELQRRLNTLGFDAGREDGILGPATESALGAFQRDAGLSTDRVCGPATVAALARLGSLAGGSVATVRERDALRRRPRRLAHLRVFIASDLDVAALSGAVATALRREGATIALDTSGEDPAFVATSANRFGADIFVGIRTSSEAGARCAYFANKTFRSEGGYCLAVRLTEALLTVLPDIDPPIGRTYRLLRDTRMAAVVCELIGAGDVAAASAVHERLPAITDAIVQGIRRGVEEPVDTSV